MANLTGSAEIFHGNTTSVDSSQQVALGTRARDVNSNEFIYLVGTASTTGGTWVTFNLQSSVTKILAANDVGPVAIAGTSIGAGQYGWYQIFGLNTIAKTDTVAALKPLFVDGTDGRADDAFVAVDRIVNAISLAADTSNVAPVFIQYPFVQGTSFNGVS